MPVTCLCVGDIHLGRPVRVPEALGAAVDARELGPAAAWRAAIDLALAEAVDAVLLAGDVVDQSNRFYEAFGALEQGVRRLAAAGIPVFGVAGNHDAEVLPRLARQVPGFHLLGRGGVWEAAEIGAAGARVLGWSFPAGSHRGNPVRGLPGAELTANTIGLLHCDLDEPDSRYAGVARADLAANALPAWLLGHIHKPSLDPSAPRPTGYLGSLSGLDRSETGPHGPWLLTLDAAGAALRHVPLAPLRWEEVEIDLTGVAAPEALDDLLPSALRRLHDRLAAELGGARAVGCSVALRGRTPAHAALVRRLAQSDLRALCLPLEGVHYFVAALDAGGLRPALNLPDLARANDPAGEMARMLLCLERCDADGVRLVEEALPRLEHVAHAAPFAALAGGPPDREAARALLLDAGYQALELLLAQQPEEEAQ